MPREITTGLQEPAGVCDIPGLDLLDTPPEEGFDRLTRLASRTLDVPIALVNLIDGDRQFFKSATGMGDVRELPVGTGVCSYALDSREPLVIEDARADPRFSANPIVTHYGLVAYIGIPLVTSAGHPLGTFCVVDLEPRAWRDGDVETMRELASAVLTEVDLRVTARELERNADEAATARAAAEAAHRSVRELVEGLDAIVWEADAATGRFSFVSRRAEEVLGYPIARWLEDPEFWRTWMLAEDQERVAASCRAATEAGRDHEVEYRAIAADGRTVWIRSSVRVLSDEQGRPSRLRGVMTDVSVRKTAESALEESEARYRSLAEDALGTSEVGTFILDQDFRVAWTNQAIERFFGLERGEAIGADKRRLIRDRIAPAIDDGDRFAERVLRTYDDNTGVVEFECRVRAEAGRPERWLAHWSRPIRGGLYAGGRIEHYYDITDRKRAEDHRARLASIVESAHDAIVGFRLDGTIESWNSAAEEMFGYRAGEMIGRAIDVLAAPGHESEPKHNLEKLVRGDAIEHFETVRRHRDGRLLEVSIASSPIRDAQGKIAGASAVIRDITDRKRAHERIHLQAQLLSAVGQAVIATDVAGRITYWNRAAEALYGWREEEVLGRDVLEVTPAEMTRDQAADLMTCLSRGESWSGEFLVRRKDGRRFEVMVTDTPVFDGDGNVTGVIGISWDLSERKRAETALQNAKEEAERANRSKTEFLSAMSHELRTPLNAIAGYLDLIHLGVHGPVTSAQSSALERIKRNQEHLLTLINDILHYAKIEAGRTEFRTAVLPVVEMLAGMEALVEPQAQARGVAYTCRAPGSPLYASCDPERVQQILLNLVGNAIKFTDPGGWAVVWCDADERQVYIRVSDNGRGISPEQLRSVFDPFVQLERHRNETSQQGVGLGLAISRDLARGMGGDIAVESTRGHGSTFTLVLPRGTPP